MTFTETKSLMDFLKPFEATFEKQAPLKRARAMIWQAAIGLQDVDQLRASDYLLEIAKRNTQGEISLQECHRLIDSYHLGTKECAAREKEADKSSINIATLLASSAFNFSAEGFIELHRKIFDGVFKSAGTLRAFDITKQEWVLDGDTVMYLNWEDLYRALDWEIQEEKKISLPSLSKEKAIEHVAHFLSNLWQIHPFSEGNTRTTAVFAILYLRSLGFHLDMRVFALHSQYFRNALVRANYRNIPKDIDYELQYLKRFLENLLLGENWELRNSDLHINKGIENRVSQRL